MEKNQIHISIEAEFHMLRHFESFSEDSLNRIRSAFNNAQIEAEIAQAGSRFYSIFANDIYSLLNQLFAKQFNEILGLNGNLVLTANADLPIGEHGVVALANLSADEKSRVNLQSNRGLQLMHLAVEQLPSTNVFCVVLKQAGAVYQFVTAFPGDEGMPLPHETLPEDYRKQCKDYWDKHVFLDRK